MANGPGRSVDSGNSYTAAMQRQELVHMLRHTDFGPGSRGVMEHVGDTIKRFFGVSGRVPEVAGPSSGMNFAGFGFALIHDGMRLS